MAITPEQKAAITAAAQAAFISYNKRTAKVLYNQANVDAVDKLLRKTLGGAQLAVEAFWLAGIVELEGQGLLEVPPTEAELAAQKEQAKRDRIARLQARDKEAGSRSANEGGQFGETEFQARIRLNKERAERDAKAAEERKKYNETHDASLGQPAGIAIQEAKDSLFSEALTRDHVRVWIKETPTQIYLQIRKMDPVLANRIDSAIRLNVDPGANQ